MWLNTYMSGVDCHDQMHMHYNVDHFAKKAWKYLMWFFVNVALVNAYILWQEKSTWPTSKWKFMHLNFRKEVACKLIGGFSSRKRKHEVSLHVGPIVTANEGNHENVQMEAGRLGMQWQMTLHAEER